MAVTYIEKGPGLFAAIAAAGLSLAQVNRVWVSSNDAAVQPFIDAYTLDQAKADKCDAVKRYANSLRDKANANISARTMTAWAVKKAEADAYSKSLGLADCPTLKDEAAARGITVPALVQKVQTNATSYRAKEVAISGNDGKHRDAIKALTTFAAVAAYDFSAGWPVV
jgi:hypothetical protein